MGVYDQIEIDVRLESEKDLKTNLAKVVKFTYDKKILEAGDTGYPLKKVESKHEGYGIAAEAFTKVQAKEKHLKNSMVEFLNLLQGEETKTIQICGTIYNHALELAMEAANMAADATRILNDLYYGDNMTPIEQIFEELKAEASVAGDDSFEEAESKESIPDAGEAEPEEQEAAEEL